jgi:hypothetical protein
MGRTQISVNAADDPDDATRTLLSVAGVGQSYDKGSFFNQPYDQDHVLQNLAINKQLNASGHIASADFQSRVNANGIQCLDKVRYLVSVTQTVPGNYLLQFGSTVDVAEVGFEIGVNDLDLMTDPVSLDHVKKNVATFLRIMGFTSMTPQAYAAINARLFWQ